MGKNNIAVHHAHNIIVILSSVMVEISWRHLEQLYEEDISGGSARLRRVPKLKYEHIHLSSYSKMQVDLAAQVLCIISGLFTCVYQCTTV